MKKSLNFYFYFLLITFFSLSIFGEETNSERQKYQVVIVGAGIAGLAAATHLLKNNVTDILILEASNRIGGRVYTSPFADFLIEYGAQWIHGQDGNPVYEIAKKYNVTDVQHMEYSFRFIKSATSKINMSIINQFAHETLDYFQDDEELIACNCSLYSYFNKRYEKLIKDNNIDEYTAQALKDIMFKFEASHDGTADLDKVGSWGITQYKMSNGSLGVAWKSGYHSFINMLLGKYENEELPVISKTRFNKVVKRVDWSKDEIDLLLEDGTHYFADHVIVTVSIGVLKHSAKTMFNPPLSERKLSAIEKLGFDIVNKIFIQFDTRWWPLDFDYNINILWSDEDKELFKRQSKYGGWITDLLGFHFVENQPRVLEGWISGDTARKTEQLSDKEITDAVLELLHWYLGDKYNISNPINMTRSSWASNKFIRGSYSFRTVESDYQGYFASDISKPIFNNRSIPVVMFAGEATHDHFYSTVHGALETGWREAKRLLAL